MKIKSSVILIIFYPLSFLSQPKILVKDSKKNFGFVKKGKVVNVEFYISNEGNEPLIIHSVDASCTCTTADFEKKPILPGHDSMIIVHFDTKGVYDRQDRTVDIVSNDPAGIKKLRYKGVVLK